jgi:hypothetical protein
VKHTPIIHDGSHAAIKLPRTLVRSLTCGKLSPSFSFKKGVEGMQLHVFCISDQGVVTDVVHGALKRVSRKGCRQWAFIPDKVENIKIFNTAALVRL